MGQILRFFQKDNSFDPGSFDPETLTLLGAAYDLTIANLHDGGQPDSACEIIASRIIASAIKGERDPQKLSRFALRGISRTG
jgi:hypothetical protein